MLLEATKNPFETGLNIKGNHWFIDLKSPGELMASSTASHRDTNIASWFLSVSRLHLLREPLDTFHPLCFKSSRLEQVSHPEISRTVSSHCLGFHWVIYQSQWPSSTTLQFAETYVTCSTLEPEVTKACGPRGQEPFFRGILMWLPEEAQMDAEWQTQWCPLHYPSFKSYIETHSFRFNFPEHPVLKNSTLNPQICLLSLSLLWQ